MIYSLLVTPTPEPKIQTPPVVPEVELLRQNQQPVAAIQTFPYKIQRSLLVPSELPFYRVLSSVIGNRAVICPKVRLGDVFFVIDFKNNRDQYFSIAERHVDFLLCEPQSLKPILGIELDDLGHSQYDRKQRDEFIKKVFEAAGLPLVRIPVQPKYDPGLLEQRLARYLGNKSDQPVA
jgi:hypothetical protein